jgi:hypothetical protein
MRWGRRIDGDDLRRPKLQDEVGDDDTGLPASCSLTESFRAMWQGRWMRPGGEEVAQGTAAASGGDGGARVCERKESRGREKLGEVSERDQGGCVTPPGARSRAGEEAGGGSRRWRPVRARATRLCLLAEVGDDWRLPVGWAGWKSWARWAAR